MYTVEAYFASKVMVEFPLFLVIPLLNACIVYFKIGAAVTAGQFFYFYLLNFLTVQGAISLGYFMSSVF